MERRDGTTPKTAGKTPQLVWLSTVSTPEETTALEQKLKRLCDNNQRQARPGSGASRTWSKNWNSADATGQMTKTRNIVVQVHAPPTRNDLPTQYQRLPNLTRTGQ